MTRPTFINHHITPSDEAMWEPLGKVWANAVQQYPPRSPRISQIIRLTVEAVGVLSFLALVCGALWSATQ